MKNVFYCAIGVDGCPGGWIAAIKIHRQPIQWHYAPDIIGILAAAPPKACILVDMIIGLPDGAQPGRLCDSLARQKITPHGARVFSAPPREVLHTENYADACALAREATGKALSKQTFNILPKIRELDAVAHDSRLREAHPELVFARFNKGRPVGASKKTTEGRTARGQLLESVLPGSKDALDLAGRHFRRKQVAPDDCLDALALCAAAVKPEQLIRLPENPAQPGISY
jgi:predicted RNase H-like nuclease